MKTKIVTAYWMDSEGYPFQGIGSIRKERYLGSLKSHCKNLGQEIIVYTHSKNLNEVQKLKDDYNLNNLTIKLLELSEVKLHSSINEVRERFFNEGLNGRGPEIMWGKFDVIERELNDCNQIYWVDCGLQHPGIFPWRYSGKYNKIEEHNGNSFNWWADYDVFNFAPIFNENLINKLNEITTNKLFVITTPNPQINHSQFIETGIIDNITSPYLIAGMFGGNTNIVKEFVDNFWGYASKILERDFLVTEEAIMKLAFDNINKEKIITFSFDVHATQGHDKYHFEMWDESWNELKPLYMVWHDIINYQN
jgi:hypothetical protein